MITSYFLPPKVITPFFIFLSLLAKNANHAAYAMARFSKTISHAVSAKLIFTKNVDSPLLMILILLINNTTCVGIVNHASNAASAAISSLIFKMDIRNTLQPNFKEL